MATLKGLLATMALVRVSLGRQTSEGNNKITYPDTSLDLHYKDTVVVSYDTDYDTPWMYIFCESGDALTEIIYYAPSDVVNKSSITFGLNYDYMATGTCFFNLRPEQHSSGDNAVVGASSPDFDYIKDEGEHQTFSAGGSSSTREATAKTTATAKGSSSVTSNSTTTAGSTASSTAVGTTTTTTTPSATVEPSRGTRTGIALGAVFVAALAAALA